MIGIKGFGIHIPRYRMSDKCISEAWGRAGSSNEKAVANFDQDTITMGVDSALDYLEHANINTNEIDGLYFSSTTPPYREKLCSSVIALAIDLQSHIRTADYLGSLRSSSSALLGAIDACKAKSCQSVLVVASDCRQVEPGSTSESLMGDGAISVLVSDSTTDNIATFLDTVSISDEFIDMWRREEDRYLRQDDARFAQQYGYQRLVDASVSKLLRATGYKPSDFARVVLPVVDARTHLAWAKKSGFDSKSQCHDSITKATGIMGTAHPFLLLCDALQEIKANEKVLFVTYGDGSDAFVLEKTNTASRNANDDCRIADALKNRRELTNYTKYLTFRNLVKGQESLTGPFSSLTMSYRERDTNMRFYGKKCEQCGLVQFLRDIHVCPACHAREKYQPIKLSKRGIIFTYNHEYYYPSPDPPTTMVNFDLPEGARITMQMTDTSPDQVHSNMPIELTFRKYHDGNFFHNYFWKCKAC